MGISVNAWLVETDDAVVLVDGAISRDATAAMRAQIAALGKPVAAALLTHGHPDHWLGLADALTNPDIPIHATEGALDQATRRMSEEVPAMRAAFGTQFPAELRLPDRIDADGTSVALGGVRFDLTEYGPAESDADATWVVETDAARHVFCGDLIYNQMHLFLLDGHAESWLDALDRLAKAHPHGTQFHPGHGETCGHEMIRWTSAYIETWLDTLGHLLGAGDASIPPDTQEQLMTTMRSFLPSDDLFTLAQFRLDETIRKLSGPARRSLETMT
jgi:glyoxylase-like metal-dependent hydrolase (beta-lactamase superfamily II)